MKTLGIDATNIQGGGGMTHLLELLTHADPKRFGFGEVRVFGGASLEKLPNPDWLRKIYVSRRKLKPWDQIVWNKIKAKNLLASSDLVFAPGSTFAVNGMRHVCLPQNMLVFDSIESGRFPFGWTKARYRILRHQQLRSLKTSVGNIFLSNYAKQSIQPFMPKTNKPTRVIHHGVDQRFLSNPKNTLSQKKHLKLLYVSTVNFYKHQWNVVDAVDKLRGTGFDLSLKLIGGGHPGAIKRLYKFIAGKTDFVEYCGSVDYETLHEEYKKADLFIFASTCENMPNILLEAMASGTPIACSNYPPMPEFLNNFGAYFDPLNTNSIYQAISDLAQNPKLAFELSCKAYQEAKNYTWKNTAEETFCFLQTCLQTHLPLQNTKK